MVQKSEVRFLKDVLKVEYLPTDTLIVGNQVSGLGISFNYYDTLNPRHYIVNASEILRPVGERAFCTMQYTDGSSASVAYTSDTYKVFTMGIPFECIISREMRNKAMQAILDFLLK